MALGSEAVWHIGSAYIGRRPKPTEIWFSRRLQDQSFTNVSPTSLTGIGLPIIGWY